MKGASTRRSNLAPLRMHPCYLPRTHAPAPSPSRAPFAMPFPRPCLRPGRPTDLVCPRLPGLDVKSFHQSTPNRLPLCAGSPLEADTAAVFSGCVRSMVGSGCCAEQCRAGVRRYACMFASADAECGSERWTNTLRIRRSQPPSRLDIVRGRGGVCSAAVVGKRWWSSSRRVTGGREE